MADKLKELRDQAKGSPGSLAAKQALINGLEAENADLRRDLRVAKQRVQQLEGSYAASEVWHKRCEEAEARVNEANSVIDKMRAGLVAAEERVRELEIAANAWHCVFGTSQLSHARAKLQSEKDGRKRAEAALAEANAAIEVWQREAQSAQERADQATVGLQVSYGPPKQDSPGGPVYRTGVSTGADPHVEKAQNALTLLQEVFMLRGTLKELLECMDTHEDDLAPVEYEAFRCQYDEAEKAARNALLTTDYHDSVTVNQEQQPSVTEGATSTTQASLRLPKDFKWPPHKPMWVGGPGEELAKRAIWSDNVNPSVPLDVKMEQQPSFGVKVRTADLPRRQPSTIIDDAQQPGVTVGGNAINTTPASTAPVADINWPNKSVYMGGPGAQQSSAEPAPVELTRRGFMDGIDWQHHLGLDGDPKGACVYPSVEACRREKSCLSKGAGCGIVDVEVRLVKWVEEQDLHAEMELPPDPVFLPDKEQQASAEPIARVCVHQNMVSLSANPSQLEALKSMHGTELYTAPPSLAAAVALRTAAESVVWFDWSANDTDAVKAIDYLRKALEEQDTKNHTSTILIGGVPFTFPVGTAQRIAASIKAERDEAAALAVEKCAKMCDPSEVNPRAAGNKGVHSILVNRAAAIRALAPTLTAEAKAMREIVAAAIWYVECALHPERSQYISENGRHGKSPWAELVDAIDAARGKP